MVHFCEHNYKLMNMIIENTDGSLVFYTTNFLTFNNVQCTMMYVIVVANCDTITITFGVSLSIGTSFMSLSFILKSYTCSKPERSFMGTLYRSVLTSSIVLTIVYL
ncbi:hypothetical protein C0J52_21692 [Blattella germanica]|nr:hypothetical protein C0J52_21692 [Blattella germanica]